MQLDSYICTFLSISQVLAAMNGYINCSYFERFGYLLMGLEMKYPLLKRRTIIVEELIDSVNDCANIVTTQLAVTGGNIIPLITSDNIYWRKHPLCFFGCAVPTVLSSELQEGVSQKVNSIMEKLLSFGYANGVMNMEFFIWYDGTIKLMEINCRLFYQAEPPIIAVYENADSMMTMIKIQLGQEVITPVLKHTLGNVSAPKYGINSYVLAKSGGLAADIYDFDKADEFERKNKDMRWKMKLKKRDRVLGDADVGHTLAWVNLVGENFEDCMIQLRSVSESLLSTDHFNEIWDDCFNWPSIYKQRLEAYNRSLNSDDKNNS